MKQRQSQSVGNIHFCQIIRSQFACEGAIKSANAAAP